MNLIPLDRFIDALYREYGDELLLETGKSVRIRMGSMERSLLAQDLRTQQIESLVAGVVPEEGRPRWQRDGEIEFVYESPFGPVQISSARKGRRLRLSISRYSVPSENPSAAEVQEVAMAVGAENAGLVLESPLDNVMVSTPIRFDPTCTLRYSQGNSARPAVWQ